MGKTISIFKESFKNIINNKLRSSLTMLGLVIGIISVILLVGIGNGATSNVKSSVQSLGTGTLTVSINSESEESLDYEQINDFTKITNIQLVAPYKSVSGTISKGTTTSRGAGIIATTPAYLNVMNLGISSGRMLSNVDLNNNSKICLIGKNLADKLFSGVKTKDIVGQSININGDRYMVVGVLAGVRQYYGKQCRQHGYNSIYNSKIFGSRYKHK